MALGAGRKGKSPAPESVETRDSGEPRPDADSAEGTDDATPAEGGTGASSSGSSGVDSTPHVITGRYRPVETWTRAASISSGEASSSRAPASARTRPTKSVDVEDVDGLPPPTHVHVAVVSCSGLRGSDWTGYADPFVEVGAFGADKKHRYRTSVAKMTLNPTWNPRLDRFLVRCGEDGTRDGTRDVPRDRGLRVRPRLGLRLGVPRGRGHRRARRAARGQVGGAQARFAAALPPDAVGVLKNGKKNKHVVPASAPAALGTVTVRIAAANDMSWDVLSDTGAVTTRPALRARAGQVRREQDRACCGEVSASRTRTFLRKPAPRGPCTRS